MARVSKTQAYFIGHCDEPECDLGAFHSTCPSCGLTDVDYDIWWEQDSIITGTPHIFECACKKEFKVEWDPEEGIFTIEAVGNES